MEFFQHFCHHQHIKTDKSTYLIRLDENITMESKQKGEQFIEAKHYYAQTTIID